MAEPEWDEATRGMVLGLAGVNLCPVCRGPAYLCQDPERQFDWKAEDPIRCHAQTARLARQQGVNEETNPQVDALLWPVSLLTDRSNA